MTLRSGKRGRPPAAARLLTGVRLAVSFCFGFLFDGPARPGASFFRKEAGVWYSLGYFRQKAERCKAEP